MRNGSFSASSVRSLGRLVDSSGIHPDPQKVETIQLMKCPTSPTEVRRLLGMANQLGKSIPSLAKVTKPLRDQLGKFTPSLAEFTKHCHDLLSSKNFWTWDEPQNQAFAAVKKILRFSPVLAHTVLNMILVSADTSAFGLGSVLLQKQLHGCQLHMRQEC